MTDTIETLRERMERGGGGAGLRGSEAAARPDQPDAGRCDLGGSGAGRRVGIDAPASRSDGPGHEPATREATRGLEGSSETGPPDAGARLPTAVNFSPLRALDEPNSGLLRHRLATRLGDQIGHGAIFARGFALVRFGLRARGAERLDPGCCGDSAPEVASNSEEVVALSQGGRYGFEARNRGPQILDTNVEVGNQHTILITPAPAPTRTAIFTLDNFGITNTRSRHEDTDFVFLSATVGGNAPVYASKAMGDVNNGTHQVGLQIEVEIPDDDSVVVFSYLIMNSGHDNDGNRTKAAQAALSTIAKEIINHKAVTVGAVAVGSILVPLFVSSLAAVAGVLAVVQVGLLLFANCDGLVAAGALPFTCSDLIRRTSSGQKFPRTPTIPASIQRPAAVPTRIIPRPDRSRRSP